VERTGFNERTDTAIAPSVEFTLTEDGDRVQASATGSFSYVYFSDDDIDSEFRANAAGRINWSLIEQRLAWVVEDYISQAPIDRFSTDAPGNVQNTNYFVTGPTARFRLSQADELRLDLRYSNSYASETDEYNSDRGLFAARALRQLNELATISANLEAELARLDDPTPTTPDFDRYAIYGRYHWVSAAIDLTTDLGWNKVNRDGADNSDGILAEVAVVYRPTALSTLRGRAGHGLSDAVHNLVLDAPTEGDLSLPVTIGVISGGAITADVAVQTRLSFSYSREVERLTFGLLAHWLDQDFLTGAAIDEESRSLVGSVDYDVSPRTAIGAFASTEWSDFAEPVEDNREDSYGLRFSYRPLVNLTIVAEAAHASRDSDLATNEFDETRFYLGMVLTRR
jgi:hypothetical protein